MQIHGPCYGLSFSQMNFLDNSRHLSIVGKNPIDGSFPTEILFSDNSIFEGASSGVTDAILVQDASGIRFRDCIFQSNASHNTLTFRGTERAATSHDHRIQSCYFEDNGDGLGSAAVNVEGHPNKPVGGFGLTDSRFHQSKANLPEYQVALMHVRQARFSGNSTFFTAQSILNRGSSTYTLTD